MPVLCKDGVCRVSERGICRANGRRSGDNESTSSGEKCAVTWRTEMKPRPHKGVRSGGSNFYLWMRDLNMFLRHIIRQTVQDIRQNKPLCKSSGRSPDYVCRQKHFLEDMQETSKDGYLADGSRDFTSSHLYWLNFFFIITICFVLIKKNY